MFEQESVAHKKGLVKGNGDMQLFDGKVNNAENETDFFSAINKEEGRQRQEVQHESD